MTRKNGTAATKETAAENDATGDIPMAKINFGACLETNEVGELVFPTSIVVEFDEKGKQVGLARGFRNMADAVKSQTAILMTKPKGDAVLFARSGKGRGPMTVTSNRKILMNSMTGA